MDARAAKHDAEPISIRYLRQRFDGRQRVVDVDAARQASRGHVAGVVRPKEPRVSGVRAARARHRGKRRSRDDAEEEREHDPRSGPPAEIATKVSPDGAHLLGPQHQCRLRSSSRARWQGRDQVPKKERGGDRQQYRRKPHGRFRYIAELIRERGPRPPARSDAERDPHDERDKDERRCLPCDGCSNLGTNEAESPEDCKVARASANGRDKDVGEGGRRQKRKQSRKHEGQIDHPLQIRRIAEIRRE